MSPPNTPSMRWMAMVLLCVAFALAAIGPLPPGASAVRAAGDANDGIGTPLHVSQPMNAAKQRGAIAIPSWSDSFTYGGTVYPYTMVGTNPAAGSATTTVPVEIIPLRVVFSNGVVLDGSDKVQATIDSPIFRAATFKSGVTQYGDAMLRASFWGDVSTTSPDWHVLLGQPTVAPAQTIVVPPAVSTEYTGTVSGKPDGFISFDWFITQIQNLLYSMHTDPRVIPMFLGYQTFLVPGFHGGDIASAQCCVLGYHSGVSSINGNGVQSIYSYLYATWTEPRVFGVSDEDLHTLSHELAELLNDPFTTDAVGNFVPAFFSRFVGCFNRLEVADPVADGYFTVSRPNGLTYHLTDVAFLSWFARRSPSTAVGGLYSYLGALTSVSPPC